ncbi:MAG: hypothetical protein AAF108_00875 [Planctomycetota bacterium]
MASAQDADSAEQVSLPDAYEVLERAIEAIGGEESIRKVNTQRMKGTFSIPAQGFSADILILRSAPDKVRIKVMSGGMTLVDRGTNGTDAWASQGPGAPPVLLKGKEKETALREGDYFSSLTPRTEYPEAETVGIETVNGERAYKLRLVDRGDKESFGYYSVENGLRLRAENDEGVQTFTKYEEHDGVLVPMAMEIAAVTPYGEIVQQMKMTSIEQNIDLARDAFSTPGSN